MFGIDDLLLAGGAALASGIGGAIGKGAAQGDKDAQMDLLRRAMNEYGQIDQPGYEDLYQELGPSALEQLSPDPKLRQAQLNALDELLRLGREGGLSLGDKAALTEAENAGSRVASANRNRIQADLDARGAGNGNTALLMQLQSGGDAAERAAQAGRQRAAMAQQKSLDALMAGGRLAGGIREQDWGENSRKAAARDEINRYNAQARSNAHQQGFQNALGVTSGKANAAAGVANQLGQNAAQTQQMWTGLGQAAAEVPKTVYAANERQKDRDAYGWSY